MPEKLKIIPLGGLGEIGKNMTVYEFGGDILVVDCGIAFPDADMLGVDLVIPDISYLVKHRNRIRAIVITHGHEDHIGALPYVLREINVPIFATRLTAGLIKVKLDEAGLLQNAKLFEVEAGMTFSAGQFKVELINVNHSIADAVSLAIKTSLGTVVHTGDFKVDMTPVQGKMIDLVRFGELGNEGVLALLSDSTNVERPGYAMSEKKVGETLDSLFKNCKDRIIVTTFASNVHRIQQIINSSIKYNRKVVISGRSMENILHISRTLGYLTFPEDALEDVSKIKSIPRHKLTIITTGSQGEPMSALYRMAFSQHKFIEISQGDRVILSASPIPGNEKPVYRMINELFKRGAEVMYEKLADLHVSGHACQEELKMMLALTKPKYFMPVHGEYRHLKAHASLGRTMGVEPKNIFLSEIGRVLEITQNGAKLAGNVQCGKVLIDGSNKDGVGTAVLRDRKVLSQDGLLVVVVTLSAQDGSIVAGPDIISRGFIYVKENEPLMDEVRKFSLDVFQKCLEGNITDWSTIKSTLRSKLSDFLYKKTRRSPMILPVIMEN